jgi:hypothetical protein
MLTIIYVFLTLMTIMFIFRLGYDNGFDDCSNWEKLHEEIYEKDTNNN